MRSPVGGSYKPPPVALRLWPFLRPVRRRHRRVPPARWEGSGPTWTWRSIEPTSRSSMMVSLYVTRVSFRSRLFVSLRVTMWDQKSPASSGPISTRSMRHPRDKSAAVENSRCSNHVPNCYRPCNRPRQLPRPEGYRATAVAVVSRGQKNLDVPPLTVHVLESCSRRPPGVIGIAVLLFHDFKRLRAASP